MKKGHQIIVALKRMMKERGLSYGMISTHLGMSEQGVKRAFARETLTLRQLELTCQAVGSSLGDVVLKAYAAAEPLRTRFTEADEGFLAGDEPCYVVFYLCTRNMTYESILQSFTFGRDELTRILVRLDERGFIEFHAGNRIKPLFSPNVEWLPFGPLKAKYDDQMKHEFIGSKFVGEWEYFKFAQGTLSKPALQVFHSKCDNFIADYKNLYSLEAANPSAEEKAPVWLLVVTRTWTFSVYEKYMRRAREGGSSEAVSGVVPVGGTQKLS